MESIHPLQRGIEETWHSLTADKKVHITGLWEEKNHNPRYSLALRGVWLQMTEAQYCINSSGHIKIGTHVYGLVRVSTEC